MAATAIVGLAAAVAATTGFAPGAATPVPPGDPLLAAGIAGPANTASANIGPDVAHQVRIERRTTIIRVAPVRRLPPLASPRAPVAVEEPYGKCVAVQELTSVTVAGERNLDVITRRGGRLRMQVDSNCMAQHFYSGFYYARPEDGKLCVKRDLLHSRSGMKCRITRISRLTTPGAEE